MIQILDDYIAACENLIAQHMLIEDTDDRQRAVDAQYAMKADFERMKNEV
jgi:hypothetical protein